jgi:hypothetical protein
MWQNASLARQVVMSTTISLAASSHLAFLITDAPLRQPAVFQAGLRCSCNLRASYEPSISTNLSRYQVLQPPIATIRQADSAYFALYLL